MTSDTQAEEDLPLDFRGEILALIDNFLSIISNQKLVDSYKVQDFCLDMRLVVANNIMENSDE